MSLQKIFVLVGLCLLGSMAIAEPITHRCATAPITLLVAQSVDVSFGDIDGFLLDVEAGETCATAIKSFTAVHNCPARITGTLTAPSGVPSGVDFSWNFIGDGQIMDLTGAGIYNGQIQVAANGVTPGTPAGTWSGGTLQICIDALAN